MDQSDKKILDIIQSEFPLDPRPYKAVGEQIGLDEEEVLARIVKLKESGVIRRMGANFHSAKLGWQSTLCAASVPPEKMELFVDEVNKLDGVTHNYLRENEFNVWFTYIGKGMDEVEDTLKGITERTGVEVLNLPADRMYKIKVDFDMESGK